MVEKSDVKEKTVAELAAELDAIASVPEDFEYASTVKDVPSNSPAPKKVVFEKTMGNLSSLLPKPPVVASPIQQLASPTPFVPVGLQQPENSAPPVPVQVESEVPLSLDAALSKYLTEQNMLIDSEATEKKKALKERVYGKFTVIVDAVANNLPLPNQEAPLIVPPVVEVVFKEKIVYVPSYEEVIKKIDVMLADPKGRGKKTLLRVKRELQGLPEPPAKEKWGFFKKK